MLAIPGARYSFGELFELNEANLSANLLVPYSLSVTIPLLNIIIHQN
jgi:hypothetical protein